MDETKDRSHVSRGSEVRLLEKSFEGNRYLLVGACIRCGKAAFSWHCVATFPYPTNVELTHLGMLSAVFQGKPVTFSNLSLPFGQSF